MPMNAESSRAGNATCRENGYIRYREHLILKLVLVYLIMLIVTVEC